MSKRKPVIDERQGVLDFMKPQKVDTHGLGIRIRQAMSEAIRKSGMDRKDICTEIYKRTGLDFTKASLDEWTAECRDRSCCNVSEDTKRSWGIPGEVIPAFCDVTGDYEILYLISGAANHKAMRGKEVVHAKIGQLKEKITRDQQELKELEKALLEGK